MSSIRGQTVGGISQIQQAFDDLLQYGIETNINLNNYKITNSADPTNNQDLTTKSYVLSQIAGGAPTTSSLAEIGIANASVASITASSQKITNLALATLSTDATNLQNITNAISSASSSYLPSTYSLSTIASTNASLSNITASSQQIKNVANPTGLQDAMTLNYSDTNYWAKIPLNQISTNSLNSGSLQMNSQKIINIDDASLSNDVPAFHQIDDAITALDLPNTYMDIGDSLAQIQVDNPSNVIMGSNYITSTSSIVSNDQYINSGQVDSKISDLSSVYTPLTNGINDIQQRTNQNLILGTNYITSSAVLANTNQLITGEQVDSKITSAGANYIPITNSLNDIQQDVPNNLDMTSYSISSSFIPVVDDNLTNKLFVDSSISNLSTVYRPISDSLSTISSSAANLSSVDMNDQKIINLLDPTLAQDAVTVSYLTSTLNDKNYIDYNNSGFQRSKVECLGDYVDIQPDIIGGSFGVKIKKNPSDSIGVGLYYTGKMYIESGSLQAVSGIDISDQFLANMADADSAQDGVNLRTMNKKTFIRNVTSDDAKIEIIGTNQIDISANSAVIASLSNNGTDGLQIDSNEINIVVSNPLAINLPITINSKIGYDPASLVSITESTQFADKAYVDASGGGSTTQSLSQISIANQNAADVDQNNYDIINCPGISFANPVSPDIQLNLNETQFNKVVSCMDSLRMDSIDKFIYMNASSDYNNVASPYAVPTMFWCSGKFIDITSSIQNIYNAVNSDILIGSNKFRSSYIPLIGDDMCNKTYVDAQIIGGGSLQTIYTAISSDLDISTNIFSSSHTATTANQLLNYSTGNTLYMPKTYSLDVISTTNPTMSSIDMNSNRIYNLLNPNTTQEPLTNQQSFWIKYPVISPTQYVSVDQLGQIDFTASSTSIGRLAVRNTQDCTFFNPSGTLRIQGQIGAGYIQFNASINDVFNILQYTGSQTASGNQIPSYSQILSEFRLSSSTLQSIYTTNISDLNIGANIFSSSYSATTANHLINKAYYDLRASGITGGYYSGGTAGDSQIYIDSTGKQLFASNLYSPYMTIDDNGNDLEIVYPASTNAGNTLTNIIIDSTAMGSWLVKTGSTAIYKQVSSVVSSAYHLFTGIASYTADYSSTFTSNLSSNMIPSILWIESRYSRQSQSPFEVGYVYGFGKSTTVAPFSTGTWLLLNGQTFSSATYPDLYTWNGNSTTLLNMDDRYTKSFKNSVNSPLDFIASSLMSHLHTNGGTTQASLTTAKTTATVQKTITSGNNSTPNPVTCSSGFTNQTLNATGGARDSIESTTGANFGNGAHTHQIVIPSLDIGQLVIPAINMDGSTTTSGNTGATTNNECNAITFAYWILAAK